MYTSLSPNNDRFGFKMSGAFKCAFNNERVILIVGLIPVLIAAAALVIDIIYLASLHNPDGSIKGGLAEVVIEDGYANVVMAHGSVMRSASIISIEALAILLALTIVAYIVLIAVIRTGRNARFEANENGMLVILPNKREESFLYKDVIAVTHTERKFPFGSRGLNVTVQTKSRSYLYRLVHTPLSRANGIYETPFNIVREQAQLSNEREQIMNYGRGD